MKTYTIKYVLEAIIEVSANTKEEALLIAESISKVSTGNWKTVSIQPNNLIIKE